MRRIVRSLVLAAGLLAAPTLAHADWQWTRWDMTSDQVIAASKGALTRQAPRPGARVHGWEMLANGQVEYEGFRFNSEFFFDADGKALKVVRLTLADVNECAALEKRMRKLYGEPVDKSLSMGSLQMKSLMWADDGKQNFAGFTSTNAVGDMAPLCFIRYRPLNFSDGPK